MVGGEDGAYTRAYIAREDNRARVRPLYLREASAMIVTSNSPTQIHYTHTHTHTRARAHTPPSPMPNDHAHSPPSAPGDHLPPGTARWVSSTRRRTSRSGSSAAPPTTPSSSAPTQESSRTPRRRHSTSAHSERSRCGTTCTHLRRDPFRSPPWTDNIFLLWTPAPLSVIGFSIGYTNTLSTYLSPAAPRPRSPA